MNTTAYIIYLSLTYFITVHVGLRFYRHGHIYILALFNGDLGLSSFINRILLAGYYLINLGYAALMLRQWEELHSWNGLIISIASMTGKILLILAIIHFANIGLVLYLSRHKSSLLNHKNTPS